MFKASSQATMDSTNSKAEPLRIFRSGSMSSLDDTVHSVRIEEVLKECVEQKYEFFIKVDPEQDFKASEIKLISFARPHM